MIEFYSTLNKPLQLIVIILLIYMLLQIVCFSIGNSRSIKDIKFKHMEGTLQEALQSARRALGFDAELYKGIIDGTPEIVTRAEEYRNYFDSKDTIIIPSAMNGCPFDEESTKGSMVADKITKHDIDNKLSKIQVMKTLIGKVYVPNDNSWSVNVTKAGSDLCINEKRYLAGTKYGDPVRNCIIVSEPFICNVQKVGKHKCEYDMIMVEYDGETHMVLFDEECVVE